MIRDWTRLEASTGFRGLAFICVELSSWAIARCRLRLGLLCWVASLGPGVWLVVVVCCYSEEPGFEIDSSDWMSDSRSGNPYDRGAR
jgi:hypothetical protein